MTVALSNARRQIADARMFTEKYKHHATCRCASYRDSSGQAFCSPGHSTWNRAINALLDLYAE